RHHGVALDAQRSRRRRDGWSDPRQDVPRRGARRGGHPEEPGKVCALYRRGGRRHDRPQRPQTVAYPQRPTGALHAGTLRRQLQLDAELGPGTARRDLREYGGQPRLVLAAYLIWRTWSSHWVGSTGNGKNPRINAG